MSTDVWIAFFIALNQVWLLAGYVTGRQRFFAFSLMWLVGAALASWVA